MCGLWKEVELGALVELLLADLATLKESLAAGVECAVEDSKEDGSLLGEDLAGLVIELSKKVDVLQDLLGIDWCRHDCYVSLEVG